MLLGAASRLSRKRLGIGTDGMPAGTTLIEVSIAASGDTTVVAAATGKRVSVYRCSLTIGGATTLTWKTASSNRRYDFVGPGSIVLDGSSVPWFTTSAGSAF